MMSHMLNPPTNLQIAKRAAESVLRTHFFILPDAQHTLAGRDLQCLTGATRHSINQQVGFETVIVPMHRIPFSGLDLWALKITSRRAHDESVSQDLEKPPIHLPLPMRQQDGHPFNVVGLKFETNASATFEVQ